MVRPRKIMEDGRLPKATQNWENSGRNRIGQPLTRRDYNVEQGMEKFGLPDEDAVNRDRSSSQIRGFV